MNWDCRELHACEFTRNEFKFKKNLFCIKIYNSRQQGEQYLACKKKSLLVFIIIGVRGNGDEIVVNIQQQCRKQRVICRGRKYAKWKTQHWLWLFKKGDLFFARFPFPILIWKSSHDLPWILLSTMVIFLTDKD